MLMRKSCHYIEFYHELIKRIEEFQYAYIDLNTGNIVVIDNKYKIIDLEPVLPLGDVNSSFYNCPSYPHDYRTTIKKIANRTSREVLPNLKKIKKRRFYLRYSKRNI